MNRLTEEFIEFAKSIGEIAGTIVFTPYGRLSLRGSRFPRTTYYYNLRKFEKKGLIKKQQKKLKSNFVLTAKGKELIHKPQPAKKIARKDGLSTVVIFDIPEDQRRERNIFRRYLIRNGYVQIQKSVLISPLTVTAELKDLLLELKIKQCVTIISGRIDHD